jgi:polyisoprenyl-phosphate glycosyltransferase
MFSLVIPVYKNEASLPSLLAALGSLKGMVKRELEVVFVVDGSPDGSHTALQRALPSLGITSQLILLSRNYGSMAALRTGLAAARGDFFAVMAADLQEPIELPAQMWARLADNSELDVIVATRESRADPLLSRLASATFWGFYRRFVVPEMPQGGIDIFACNRPFRDSLVSLSESHSSLIAQIFWLGFRRETISYSRQVRQHGKSAWTLRKKLTYLSDSIFSFTDLPVRWLTRIGAVGAIGSFGFGIALMLARLLGDVAVPGYTATMLTIIFFGALNLMAIGIVGSYAWRAFENTKQRPLSIVLKHQYYEAAETSQARVATRVGSEVAA